MRILFQVAVIVIISACKPEIGTAQNDSLSSSSELLQVVGRAADRTGCASHSWRDRGVGAQPFFRGMGIAFAKAICQPRTKLTLEIESAQGPATKDALTFLSNRIAALQTQASAHPTLVKLFTVATGLAQMESNGRYCVGRDRSANFTSAESAEAGIFQTSWGAHVSSPVLEPLFRAYQADSSACELGLFQAPMPRCSAGDAESFGLGTGADWQKLTKSCPMFAIEYGLVVMRKSGGGSGEFGPVRHDQVEVIQQCADFYIAIEDSIAQDRSLCDDFK